MNNTGPAVRNRGVDRRVVRTRRALGDALMRLLQERSLESITVQDVLDAAGVGRATFYGHFRGKQDLLLSHFESVMAWMAARLQIDSPESRRVAPVAEIFAHVAHAREPIAAVAASGQLEALWDLGRSHMEAMIAGRLALLNPGESPQRMAIASHFCAGALTELLRWWLWRPDRPTPEEMDAIYHEMVWNGLPPST
ncbi:MAG TPA: helix-turn-helix domain-containing protein [Longimicrobium sp.]|jgi:AcrR family transcriptional regulator